MSLLEDSVERILRYTPREVRTELIRGSSADMKRRRGIVATSLLGMAGMTAVSLLQTGIVKHLPDPPIKGFDSDRVNLGRTAYAVGIPDGTISLASLALNLPLAAMGGRNRHRRIPWIPVVAAGKAAVEAAAAAWYFYQMPTKEKAWCGYCILGAVANAAIFALTIPEARKAIAELRG